MLKEEVDDANRKVTAEAAASRRESEDGRNMAVGEGQL
jgi:hypothetical protein